MAMADRATFKNFLSRYKSKEICRAVLFCRRFPNGLACPKFGCAEYYPIPRNNYKCRACRHQTSVTAGTVMHRTRLSLTVRLWAIYLCTTDKRVRGTDKQKAVIALSKSKQGTALFAHIKVVQNVAAKLLQIQRMNSSQRAVR